MSSPEFVADELLAANHRIMVLSKRRGILAPISHENPIEVGTSNTSLMLQGLPH